MARPLPQPARIYEVGGAVRDALLGRPNADRDYVVVGVTPETMLASGFRPVGRDFPVFLHPETNEEYALARTERKHGRGYRGFEFFASPDVTLEEDLARRDLTINAMARGDDGRIIDPHAGQLDLAARVLRHVSPAFVEDPLRVLRVARFAARLGFAVAPETEALMRSIVASGELSTLAPERVWQELAKGLVETRPSQMLAVLRQCGALAKLLPEVDATFGMARMQSPPDGVVGAGVSGASVPDAIVPDAVVPNAVVPNAAVPDAGVLTSRALDWAADHGATLAARYAILLHDLSATNVAQASQRLPLASTLRSIRLAERVSARLKVPLECQDAARLAAQLWRKVNGAAELTPAGLLDLLNAADALRRPARLETLVEACAAVACSPPGALQDYPPAPLLREALAIVRTVDAGAAARAVGGARSGGITSGSGKSGSAKSGNAKSGNAKSNPAPHGVDVIAKAVRAARLKALRAWRGNRT